MQPAVNAATAKPVYIQTSFGSTAVGDSAIASAEPKALVSRNIDITNDFMLGGALVKAYSSPVMLARISERPMKRYAGVCTATWTSLPVEQDAADG